MIAGLDTDRPSDIRARAVVMLLAVYGLRSIEIRRMKLEDIDWEHSRIKIRQAKGGSTRIYPLVPEAGNAIAKYLRFVRPRCGFREVFLNELAPRRPISHASIYIIVNKSMTKFDVYSPKNGPHALRHACATHLVEEGLSFKEIGDLLGHRKMTSTQIYAKVDMPHLREVAAFDLGGLI
jgi:site-specific recombinase XerD